MYSIKVYFVHLDKDIRIGSLMSMSMFRFCCRRPLGKLLGALSNRALCFNESRVTLREILPVE